MSTILITGVSGFIGGALAKELAGKHQVIGMSRKDPGIENIDFVKGDFAQFEDLRQLDKYDIDVLVHLSAVTGGCSERDGIVVNVEGTRCLMRYLIDRSCKKFVMASSIALIGLQNVKFRPLQLPVPDEHPCLDRDGYGFSKYMMEELTRYYALQDPELDIINLRLSAISPDENPPDLLGVCSLHPWRLATITQMLLSDSVKVFALATKAPYKKGLRIMNAAASESWVKVPTADVIRGWWGDDVDLSFFADHAKTFAGAYDVSLVEKELGFTAENTLKHLHSKRSV